MVDLSEQQIAKFIKFNKKRREMGEIPLTEDEYKHYLATKVLPIPYRSHAIPSYKIPEDRNPYKYPSYSENDKTNQ